MSDIETKQQEPTGKELINKTWPMINFRMPPEQAQQLDDYAYSHCVDRSSVIRTALINSGVIAPREVKR